MKPSFGLNDTPFTPDDSLELLGEVTGDPHGLLTYDNSQSTLAFDTLNRTVTITPVGASFDYYISGDKYTISAVKSVVFPDIEGVHFFYLDSSGTIQSTQIFTTARANAYCAVLYWDATNKVIIYQANERHTTTFPVEVWLYNHITFGTQWRSGGALSGITVDGTGNNNSDATFTVASSIIDDEDIRHTLAQQTTYDLFYKLGASGDWRIAQSASPYGVYSPTSRSMYNQFTAGAWQLTLVSNNDFVLAHVFATNNLISPYIVVIGQNIYTTAALAREGANEEINNLILTGLPFQEFTPVASLIYQTSNAYLNDPQSRLRTVDVATGATYVNWLGQKLSPSVNPVAHNNLSDIQLAGTGVTYGHISDSSQTIAGQKTFSQNILLPFESVSRTIYVSPAGNDNTGDGTILLPYLTYAKALSTINQYLNSGITVTIHSVTGSILLTESDLYVISLFKGSGTLHFEGDDFTLADSGFTMGAASGTDPLTYSVSGGNTGTWTLNQWKYYFLKSGTEFFPITHNALTPTLSLTRDITGNEIYQAVSIMNINLASNFTFNVNVNLTFTKLAINITNFTLTVNCSKSLNFTYNKVTSLNSVTIQGTGDLTLTCNSFNCSTSFFSCQVFLSFFNNNLFYSNINGAVFRYSYNNGVNNTLYTNVFENISASANSTGMLINNASSYLNSRSPSVAKYLKFVSCQTAITFNSFSNTINATTLSIILVNSVKYFIRWTGTNDFEPCQIIFYNNFFGTPATTYFKNVILEFVNPKSQRNIQIIGLTYPEFENNLSSALADNATTNIVIGNKLQNRTINVNYTITRGTDYETNVLTIIHDGTSLVLNEPTPIGDDVGASFAVAFSGNDIQLQVALTSTGTAATIKYNAERVLITPLTI